MWLLIAVVIILILFEMVIRLAYTSINVGSTLRRHPENADLGRNIACKKLWFVSFKMTPLQGVNFKKLLTFGDFDVEMYTIISAVNAV